MTRTLVFFDLDNILKVKSLFLGIRQTDRLLSAHSTVTTNDETSDLQLQIATSF